MPPSQAEYFNELQTTEDWALRQPYYYYYYHYQCLNCEKITRGVENYWRRQGGGVWGGSVPLPRMGARGCHSWEIFII